VEKVFIEVAKQSLHGCFEAGELVLYDVPYDLTVDAEVLVDQDISEPRDLFPFHARRIGANRVGTLLAASPIISRLRTTASKVLSSWMNAALERPAVYDRTLWTASKISSR
jgi:hypothetical protein